MRGVARKVGVKVCANPDCGAPFAASHGAQRFCDPECREACRGRKDHTATRPTSDQVKERPCLWCGKPFESSWAGERCCPACRRDHKYRHELVEWPGAVATIEGRIAGVLG